jgi:hypothetical protein
LLKQEEEIELEKIAEKRIHYYTGRNKDQGQVIFTTKKLLLISNHCKYNRKRMFLSGIIIANVALLYKIEISRETKKYL